MRHSLTLALIVGVLFLTLSAQSMAQQSDTSSFFPRGLWGIWIDNGNPPFNPPSGAGVNWTGEGLNWTAINANYLVYWIPNWVESNVMSFADGNNYRMDIANWDYNFQYSDANSLISWIINQSTDTVQAINIINNLNQQWGSHTGLYTYAVGHETPVVSSSYWWNVEFACRKINQLNASRRSYIVSPGTPSSDFVNATPHLDIIDVEDGYPFDATVAQQYNSQQSVLAVMLAQIYNPTMNNLRGKHTEWHACIQTEHEDRTPPPSLRRPNIQELRAQVYLALSRGARGITSFVYGSWPNCTNPPVTAFWGLVDASRNKITPQSDPDGVAAFDNLATVYNEINPLGPTIRKLRIYDAFPNSAIPSSNIAKITSITGDKIESGVFKRIDQGSDSTVYFMLVNRVCNKQDGSVSAPQSVTATFALQSGTWEITDVASGNLWIIPNNGSFSDNLNPGAGKLYKLASSTGTWSGTKALASNVTVCSGATLTVSPGATITFPVGVSGGYGAMLNIIGQLNAQGNSSQRITFDRIGNSGSWYGLNLSSSCTANINYCNFNDATVGVTCNTSSATISNSTFFNNYFGIYCNPVTSATQIQYNDIENSSYSGIYLSNASPHLKENKIKNNALYGVFCYNYSSPQLDSNTVSGSTGAGIECEYNSSPLLYRVYPHIGDGHNVISSNVMGLHAYVNCGPVIGLHNYGRNSLYSNSVYNVSATNGCSITAELTWWGSAQPDTTKFYLSQSTLDYSNYLSSDPNSGMQGNVLVSGQVVASSGNGPTLDTTLYKVFDDCAAGDYDSAAAICLKVFNGSLSTSSAARQALLLLSNTYEWSGKAGFLDFLNSLISANTATNTDLSIISRQLQAHWLTKAGRYSEAINTFQALHSDFSGTPDIDKFALFNIAEIYHTYLNDVANASVAIEDFLSRYPSDPLAAVARILIPLGNSSSAALKSAVLVQAEGDQVENKVAPPTGFGLEANYPNPFNPSTQISYSLPEAAQVLLVIYDVLGREIATLAKEYHQAGRYTVVWNSQSSGVPVSSGMYFARLKVLNDLGGVKFAKTIKLLLTK